MNHMNYRESWQSSPLARKGIYRGANLTEMKNKASGIKKSLSSLFSESCGHDIQKISVRQNIPSYVDLIESKMTDDDMRDFIKKKRSQSYMLGGAAAGTSLGTMGAALKKNSMAKAGLAGVGAGIAASAAGKFIGKYAPISQSNLDRHNELKQRYNKRYMGGDEESNFRKGYSADTRREIYNKMRNQSRGSVAGAIAGGALGYVAGKVSKNPVIQSTSGILGASLGSAAGNFGGLALTKNKFSKDFNPADSDRSDGRSKIAGAYLMIKKMPPKDQRGPSKDQETPQPSSKSPGPGWKMTFGEWRKKGQ